MGMTVVSCTSVRDNGGKEEGERTRTEIYMMTFVIPVVKLNFITKYSTVHALPAPASSLQSPRLFFAGCALMTPAGLSASAALAGSSSASTSAASAAAQLRDAALAAATTLEAEASSLRASNAERSQQLQEEVDLLKSAAAAQERVHATAATLHARLHPAPPQDDDAGDGSLDDVDLSSSEVVAIAHLQSQVVAV
ncbi:hypothetical protein GUJ93_ZPchr0011g28129 [Zizania palustris]|uniref:Uncharacterized protein n=1 Tax=Zizania palustris TaxID=103762 RepID=A0A8J5WKU4_ZIZPA|nr:hypothetical protein GUJ93_ZPchr0011g28129 [Zizania palustris]